MRRVEVFGSGARGVDFDPQRSDVDSLIEFDTSDGAPTLKAFFALKDELAAVLGRPVDLVMAGSLANPFLKAEVDRTGEAVLRRDPRAYLWDAQAGAGTDRRMSPAAPRRVAGGLPTGTRERPAEPHRAAGVGGHMLNDIVEVEPRGECRIWLRFQDGAEAEVDLELALIFQGVFAPLPRPLPLCASTGAGNDLLAQ